MSENPELIQQLADRLKLDETRDKFLELVKAFVARMDPVKGALYVGLAYLGYENLPFKSDVLKIMWGPIGLELSTTPVTGGDVKLSILGVEFPVNSQVAGLGMLATLGFSCMPWQGIGNQIQKQSDEVKNVLDRGNSARATYASVMNDFDLETTTRLITAVVAGFQGHTDITGAKAELEAWLNQMIPVWQARKEALERANGEPNKGSAR